MHKAAIAFVEAKVLVAKPLDSVEVPTSKKILYNKTQFQKVTVDVSKKITLFIVERIKDFDSNAHHIMLEIFLSHSLLNGMLPNYLTDLKCVK
jgi:hypothetical protein